MRIDVFLIFELHFAVILGNIAKKCDSKGNKKAQKIGYYNFGITSVAHYAPIRALLAQEVILWIDDNESRIEFIKFHLLSPCTKFLWPQTPVGF